MDTTSIWVMAATDTSAEALPEAAPAKRPGRGGLVIVVGIVLILAAVGGGGAYWYLLMGPAAAQSETAADTPVAEPEPGYTYLSLNPFVIHTVAEDGKTSHVAIAVALELPGEGVPLGHYDRQRPRLRDAILRALHRPAMRLQPGDGRLSLDEVKQRIAAASETVLGAGVVHAVLIQGEY